MSVSFDVITSFKTARIGVLNTYYGKVNSPFFMPVGTAGAIKAINIEEVEKIGFQMILSNTYHLMLRPGENIINQLGGVRQFMNNGHISYKPKIGDFYIFPNYLYHSVNPFFGPGERRSISFNALIDDKIYNVY